MSTPPTQTKAQNLSGEGEQGEALRRALELLARFDADEHFGRPGDADCQVVADPSGSSDEDFAVLLRRLLGMKQWAQEFWSAAQAILSENEGGSPATWASSQDSPPSSTVAGAQEKILEKTEADVNAGDATRQKE